MEALIILDRQQLYSTLSMRFGSVQAGAAMADIEKVERTDLAASLRIGESRPKEANECGCQG